MRKRIIRTLAWRGRGDTTIKSSMQTTQNNKMMQPVKTKKVSFSAAIMPTKMEGNVITEAKLLEVSVEEEPEEKIKEDTSGLSKFERFGRLLRRFNLTPEKFGASIGVSRASVYAWLTDSKNYGQRPTVQNRAKIEAIIGEEYTQEFFD